MTVPGYVPAIGEQDLNKVIRAVRNLYENGASQSDVSSVSSSLSNVTNDAQTKAAIVPNTAPGAGQILVGNDGGTAYAPVSASGDATLLSTGAISVAKTGGVAFGSAATKNATTTATAGSVVQWDTGNKYPAGNGSLITNVLGAAAAWVVFTGSTAAIIGSNNVTSVTRSAAGDYVVNFTSALASSNYAAVCGCQQPPAGNNPVASGALNYTTGHFEIYCRQGTANVDPQNVVAVVFI